MDTAETGPNHDRPSQQARSTYPNRAPRPVKRRAKNRHKRGQEPLLQTSFIAAFALEVRQARPGRSACPCTPKPSLVGVTAGDVVTEPAPVQIPTVRPCPMGLKVACGPAGGRDTRPSSRASGQALTGAALPRTINAHREAGPRRFLGSWRRRGRQP